MDTGLFDGLNGIDPTQAHLEASHAVLNKTNDLIRQEQARINQRARELMLQAIHNIVDICVVERQHRDHTQANYDALKEAIRTKSKDVIEARFDGFTTALQYQRKYSDVLDRNLEVFRTLLKQL